MLVSNTFVRTTRHGARIPVETLSIADRIYDPITDTDDEIVDILTRKITPTKAMQLGLWPVKLEKDAISQGAPIAKTHLSPQQGIVVLEDIPGNDRHKALVVKPAVSIPSAQPSDMTEDLTYYCIFFGRKRYVEANGLSLPAYTLEDISRA